MPINRHVFIQESKLPNLMGRIDYITSPKRQEYLYATYDTTLRSFWKELAKENQRMFKESGTEGRCIEARELIIALPEVLTEQAPEDVLRGVIWHFQQKYDVNCIGALHHNKRKTNYHIHLIFSERRLLDTVVEKTATRNMFYDETGKHVRTKKEILDENGVIRAGCKIIKKGEVYERDMFTPKDKQFKSEAFLKESKIYLMDHINSLLPDGYPKLAIFDDGEIYLPTKKIGKNNPKEAEIRAQNALRIEWNRMADEALVAGVPEAQIKQVKQEEITEKVQASIKEHGNDPGRFNLILRSAISRLYQLIQAVREKLQAVVKTLGTGQKKLGNKPAEPEPPVSKVTVTQQPKEQAKPDIAPKPKEQEKPDIPPKPVMPAAVKKFTTLERTMKKMERVNTVLARIEKNKNALETRLENTTGFFKGGERDRLAGMIAEKLVKISEKQTELKTIAKEAGFDTVQAFMKAYNKAKDAKEGYEAAVEEWKDMYTRDVSEMRFLRSRLSYYDRESKKRNAERIREPKKQRRSHDMSL